MRKNTKKKYCKDVFLCIYIYYICTYMYTYNTGSLFGIFVVELVFYFSFIFICLSWVFVFARVLSIYKVAERIRYDEPSYIFCTVEQRHRRWFLQDFNFKISPKPNGKYWDIYFCVQLAISTDLCVFHNCPRFFMK